MMERKHGFKLLYKNTTDIKNKNFFERNPSQIQFWVAISVLFGSLWYSNKSLKETKAAYDLNRKQYILNRQQFDSANSLNKKAETRIRLKEIEDVQNYRADTQRTNKRDKFQKESFSAQLSVYKQQLSSFKTQAEIAKSQFQFQKRLNAQLIYEGRPSFVLAQVYFDTSKNVAEFIIQNTGKNATVVNNSIFLAINPKSFSFSKNIDSVGKTALNNNTSSGFLLKMEKSDFENPLTYYYLTFQYSGQVDEKPLIYHHFFHFVKNENNTFSWFDMNFKEQLFFKTFALQKGIKI